MNDDWSLPLVLGQNLRILFRTQFSLLDKELRFYSEKERRTDKDDLKNRRELPVQTRLRLHHHHRSEES